jgi:hypothetical protein
MREVGNCRNKASHTACTDTGQSMDISFGMPSAQTNDPKLGYRQWRIRQSALYHRYDTGKKSSVYMLVSPHKNSVGETACVRRVLNMEHLRPSHLTHFVLHEALTRSYVANWRKYMRTFEAMLLDLVGHSRLLN